MLKIKNFTKKYGDTPAVDNLSIEIENGKICAFIGHNGAGKTTTLKAIAGILDFDEGEITVDGMSIKKNPMDVKRIMAYLPDNPDIYEFMSATDYLNFIADVYGMSQEDRKTKIEKYAELFGITESLGNKLSEFSHGMKQKVAIISAIMHEPKLLLMDEPFVGLDPIASHQLKDILHEMCEKGSCIFYSTHVLEVAEKLCDEVVIVKGGKLVKQGKMSDIKGDSSLENVFLELEDKE